MLFDCYGLCEDCLYAVFRAHHGPQKVAAELIQPLDMYYRGRNTTEQSGQLLRLMRLFQRETTTLHSSLP